MKKILFIAQNFPPAGGSDVQRGLKFVKYLPQFGYQPVVLTLPAEDVHEHEDRSLLEESAGIEIHRIGLPKHWIDRVWPRKLHYLLQHLFLLPDPWILWRSPIVSFVQERFAPGEIDLVFITCPPSSFTFLTEPLQSYLSCPVVLEYRLPASQARRIYQYPSQWHERFIDRSIQKAVRTAGAVVVPTPGLIRMFKAWQPGCVSKLHLVWEGYDEADFTGLEALDSVIRKGSDPAILHVGYAGVMHSPEKKTPSRLKRLWMALAGQGRKPSLDLSGYSVKALLQGVQALCKDDPKRVERIRIHLCGTIAPGNFELAERLGLSRCIEHYGYLPHRQALKLLSEVDLLFSPMVEGFGHEENFIIPGKIFEYLRLGKPMLTLTPRGTLDDFLVQNRVGWVGRPDEPERTAVMLREIQDLQGRGALKAPADPDWVQPYQRREATRVLAGIFDQVLRSRV